MDHNEAVRQKTTERYLLNELDEQERDQFEEHLFDCQECAIDLRAAALFVDQAKIELAEEPVSAAAPVRAAETRPGWFAWLRPAFAVPVMAMLLAVIGYQNLVQVPRLMQAANSGRTENTLVASNQAPGQPLALPYASVNAETRGPAPTQVTITPGQGFNLMVSIPPDKKYSADILELYNPTGKLQWSLRIPTGSEDDERSILVPGAGLEAGEYKLKTSGVTPDGTITEIGTNPIQVQVQR